MWVTTHKNVINGVAGIVVRFMACVDEVLKMDLPKLERTRVKETQCVVRSIAERHSPPVRKNVLTKTYPTPQTIIPVEIRGGLTKNG